MSGATPRLGLSDVITARDEAVRDTALESMCDGAALREGQQLALDSSTKLSRIRSGRSL